MKFQLPTSEFRILPISSIWYQISSICLTNSNCEINFVCSKSISYSFHKIHLNWKIFRKQYGNPKSRQFNYCLIFLIVFIRCQIILKIPATIYKYFWSNDFFNKFENICRVLMSRLKYQAENLLMERVMKILWFLEKVRRAENPNTTLYFQYIAEGFHSKLLIMQKSLEKPLNI